RSESGRSRVTPHGPPQHPAEPISRFRSTGAGQQDEHSAATGPASSAKARMSNPRRRRARIPAIFADNPIWAEPIPGVTEKAYSGPPDMCDVLESDAGSDASCLLVQTSTLAGAHPARRDAQNRWFPTRSESTNIRRPAAYRRGG